MTFSPFWPVWVIVIFAVALGSYLLFALVLSTPSTRKWWIGRLLMSSALITALLGPGVGVTSAVVANESVDVLFVVDTSASMGAEDWNGHDQRITGVRQDIATLAKKHLGARFAVVTFDSQAMERQPFIADTTALQQTVDRLYPESASHAAGSSISAASELVASILKTISEDEPERSRVVYYFGDGEQTAAEQPETFDGSRQLINGGAVFGYGTDAGGAIPRYDSFGNHSGYFTDGHGGEAKSHLDAVALEAIAGELSVPYVERVAGEPIEAASVDVSRVVSDESTQTTFPIYWVFAILVALWLSAEAWHLTRELRPLRRAERDLNDD